MVRDVIDAIPAGRRRGPSASRVVRRGNRVAVLGACLLAGCHAFGPIDQDVLQEVLDLTARRDAAALAPRARHASARVRAWAVRGLGTIGDPAALAVVTRAITDADPRVRTNAALALALLGGGEPALELALGGDADPDVRRLCALGLARAARLEEGATAALRARLEDADGDVRGAAAWALACHAAGNVERARLAALLAERVSREPHRRAKLVHLAAMARLGAAAVRPLTDLVVSSPRTPDEEALRARALAALPAEVDGADHPALRQTLQRLVRGTDAGLAADAADVLGRWAAAGTSGDDDARALLDAVQAGRAPAALPHLVAAAVAACRTPSLHGELVDALESGTASDLPGRRSACLDAFAAAAGPAAMQALRHAMRSAEVVTRAGAVRGLARLPRHGRDVDALLRETLRDPSPWVRGTFLHALAEDPAERVLRALAEIEPEILNSLAEVLRPPFDATLAPRLLLGAARDDGPWPLRELVVHAAGLLLDAEDRSSQMLLERLRGTDGPPARAVSALASVPRLRTDFDWDWLRRAPRLAVRTTVGTFHIEIDAETVPVHAHQLVRRALDPQRAPTEVLERRDGCVRFGRTDRIRLVAASLLPSEPNANDAFAIGLVACVPSGLPDLDGSDLCVNLRPRPDWFARRTVVGRVTDGMEVVEALQAGAKILDISLTTRPD